MGEWKGILAQFVTIAIVTFKAVAIAATTGLCLQGNLPLQTAPTRSGQWMELLIKSAFSPFEHHHHLPNIWHSNSHWNGHVKLLWLSIRLRFEFSAWFHVKSCVPQAMFVAALCPDFFKMIPLNLNPFIFLSCFKILWICQQELLNWELAV